MSELNDFYRKLLEEHRVDKSQTIREITSKIPTILNQDHNKMLLQEASMQEVEEAVMSMPNGKALGPDGFTIDFFKIY